MQQQTNLEKTAKKLQRQHAASEARSERLQMAIETQDMTKQGQKVYVLPAFDAGLDAESEHIIESVREALPEYHCEQVHVPGLTEDDIHDLMADCAEREADDE